jgi:UDP-N-acetylmuramoyl-L-alanyl-D-glutamate--2,6-diaminopimelate ligase
MQLDQIFTGISGVKVHGDGDLLVTGITSHSKNVAPGNLFIALSGNQYQGSAFIDEAINGGAIAVLTDLYNPFLAAVQVVHENPSSLVPTLASRFYGNPSEKQFVVGVTGTNGKTTTAYLIAHLLEPCGLISTIEYRMGNLRIPATLTTPDLLTTQKMLSESVRAGMGGSVMEVSSHALMQNRTDGITFSAAVFTNLSQDHLDYHGTMEEYLEAKMRLFTSLETTAVLNADDKATDEICKRTPANIVTYGIEKEAQLTAANIVCTEKNISFDAPFPVTVPLVGRYSVYNVLAAIAVAQLYDLPQEVIQERLANFPAVPGRMQPVPNELGLCIYIDFAHTPAALSNALHALRPLCEGKLTVVFGCGGERDMEKRPLMGDVARELADHVIITSDNPRGEDPISICEQIGGRTVIVDREDAIGVAIDTAMPGDVLLIAGRGHEREQIIGANRRPFLDYDIAREAVENRMSVLNR